MAARACADCGNPRDLRPLRLLTNPHARWLCIDTDACVARVIQAAYWLTRRSPVLIPSNNARPTGPTVTGPWDGKEKGNPKS